MKRPSAAMASASSSVTQRTWATSSGWSFRAFRSTSRSTRKKSSNPWGKFTLSVARTPVRSRGYPSSSRHSRSAAMRLSSPASTPPASGHIPPARPDHLAGSPLLDQHPPVGGKDANVHHRPVLSRLLVPVAFRRLSQRDPVFIVQIYQLHILLLTGAALSRNRRPDDRRGSPRWLHGETAPSHPRPDPSYKTRRLPHRHNRNERTLHSCLPYLHLSQ